MSCGDVQVEKGAVLAGGVFSIHANKATKPADKPESKAESVEHSGLKLAAAE